jgi:D-alanyl-D-alanine carboxypeptidase/D-alanyl-D-alanine-endopeptidase (penicillin-binding protein 4)
MLASGVSAAQQSVPAPSAANPANAPQTTFPVPPPPPKAESPAQRSLREIRTRRLTDKINALLAQPEATRAFWGIEIFSLSHGRPLYEQNSDKLFAPASNKKLFTTAIALALLGADYRYRTTVETSGTIDQQGHLHGDLKLVGHGDPNLSGRVLPYLLKTERTTPPLLVLEQLADQVAQKGVREIDGDVIGDDSYFAFERYPDGWAQDDLLWDYGAGVSALTVNDNVVFLTILPGAVVGDKARMQFDPDFPYYEVNNLVTTTAAASGPRKISIDRQPGSRILTIWGTVPMDDSGHNDALAIEDPADFAAIAFQTLLERRGIAIKGKERTAHAYLSSLPSPPPPVIEATAAKSDAVAISPGGGTEIASLKPVTSDVPKLVLASHESGPLVDDLQVINKVSQNLHAEIALRTVGREKGTAPTLDAALEVEKNFLAQAGVAKEEFAFFDGSGLSRQSLVTPRAVVKLLQFADAHTPGWGTDFRRTLPVAGVDGSLADRFKGTAAQGRVQAKTGSYSHVNALSGYAETLSGERVAFSILCNNHKLTGRGALSLIDQIVQEIVQDGAK